MKSTKVLLTWMLALAMSVMISGVSLADPGKGPLEVAPQKTEKEMAEDWIMGFMTKNAPPGRKTYYIDAQETKEDAITRYRSIAKDLVEVAYHPNNRPLFGGEYGRAQTISVMLGVMLYESGFGRHVDFGVGKFGRGDNGKSWCLLQINIGHGRIWPNGWNTKEHRPWQSGDKVEDRELGASGPEMVKDRRLCFKEALRAMRLSFGACSRNPVKERLNAYASGSCAKGGKGSRLRLTAAMRFWDETRDARQLFKDAPVSEQLLAELAQRNAPPAVIGESVLPDDDKKSETPSTKSSSTDVEKSKTSRQRSGQQPTPVVAGS